ncbi:MAG: c-type cytochrome [Mariprofundales bacterium]
MANTPILGSFSIATLIALLLLGCQQEPTTPQHDAAKSAASAMRATYSEAVQPPTNRISSVAVTKAAKTDTAQALKQMVTQGISPSTPVASTATQVIAGDASRGKRLARKCQSCHNLNTRRKLGPGLAGIYNRAAGLMTDSRYSPELAKKSWHWDDTHLAAWACDSRAAVRAFSGNPNASTKMPAQRICNPQQQADLTAYLKTL